jgi:hypothetical protein
VKLAKCPLCGRRPADDGGMVWCPWLTCGLTGRFIPRVWNRLAALVRKGRMFEWLERNQSNDNAIGLSALVMTELVEATLESARDWWRKRRKKVMP